jgi:hypothetical protein
LFDRGGSAFHESERYHGVAFLAETARQAGCVEEARSIVAELSQQALTSPAPTLLVHLDYAHAVLASDNNAEQLFTEALFRNLERWPWHRAACNWRTARGFVVSADRPTRVPPCALHMPALS